MGGGAFVLWAPGVSSGVSSDTDEATSACKGKREQNPTHRQGLLSTALLVLEMLPADAPGTPAPAPLPLASVATRFVLGLSCTAASTKRSPKFLASTFLHQPQGSLLRP